MAAAYGALVSLMQLIDQIQYHPRPPISLDKEQTQSLTEKVAFLQDFLEAYNFHGVTKEAEDLMSRIADAAYATEDVIESRVVDQILGQSTSSHDGEKINSVDFYRGLQKVIESMDLIKKDVMEIKDKTTFHHQQPKDTAATTDASSKSHSTEQNNMVGFDDVLKEMLDKLTGEPSHRQIIPISGMGGIGKTTLARNVYTNSSIKHHFDACSWVTISQQYNIREILLEVILCQNDQESRGSLSQMSEKDLVEMLHKSLFGKRYLIIMDDMWDVEAWEDIKFCFPENKNGSRIVVTTRIPKVVLHFAGSYDLKMKFLNEANSWKLFCENVFGKEDCPDELEEVGKKIAKKCKGLPLSIVVIGGLAKSKQTTENWEFIAENLNSVVNLEDQERCFKILHTSYNQLPIHLKPCFLYMGLFPEDSHINISRLIKQWVAEGFVKPSRSKSLEETGEEYLMDLIERNLVLVSTNEWIRGKKTCNIHDLLRDLCLREAQKEKFFSVTSQHSLNIIPEGTSTQRRFIIHGSKSKEEYHPQVLDALESASFARSLMCHYKGDLPSLGTFRLLRILKAVGTKERSYPVADIFQLVNSRYIDMTAYWDPSYSISSSFYLLWNLQTLIVNKMSAKTIAPFEFWMMPLLRHVQFDKLYLPNPPSGQMDERDNFVMENLQTLSRIENFSCSEDVVKRIPNVRELGISYEDFEEGFEVASHYHLYNLDRLHKLESLACHFEVGKKPSRSDLISFPNSLKELTLEGTRLKWEDMSTKMGLLPLLQVLNLEGESCIGPKWETSEGQFPSLKYLKIGGCFQLKYWTAESAHFPRLEHLELMGLLYLEEIPSEIGEIPTLKSIELIACSPSAFISAKTILEEQEEVGNEDIEVEAPLGPMGDLVKLLRLVYDNFISDDDEW